MVSMARPLLADPLWVAKARKGKAHEINTCIACNQACLDHVFQNRRASCLVNPRACHETELEYTPTNAPRTEEHPSELQSLMRNSSAFFHLKKKYRHLYTDKS